MSGLAPIATELMRRGSPPLCAASGCEQMQQVAPLFDHLFGEGAQLQRDIDTEREWEKGWG